MPKNQLDYQYEAINKGLPEHTAYSLAVFVTTGSLPGGFLRAVLKNDLMEAVAQADSENLAALKDICLFIHNHIPADCHGSLENVNTWALHNGLTAYQKS
jgi:hypothetical protein